VARRVISVWIERKARELDQVIQACMSFAQAGTGEEFVLLQIALEGIVGEAEMGEIHQRESPLVRTLRPETT